ncbi:MAG: betaine/proline/choline family ABC transporter ATP-binding protein [Trichococcus flocculiformis]|jgi:osmoprotectant transport system ATP-binding protein|uniref:Quaternary amine transport ATP-binding protein n=1 Tax=Trichococcus flocculiformis TaxID=82803 RepID=A0A143YIR0_9LACT|nr:betaine/proline/choline family ABC transporter ATP-binding protein [Trichococcus flocculiformis]NLD30850.1 betaine/proline/choline family ABC transporter ATP-binding protein [Trichococcus flocculiformis]CZQ89582.1 aldolase-type tim barrel [Trichococcus flocculiformis]SFH48028.1 osmoprotectant transport system ATP-binding protein [Trichococcus flocculiformis]
MIEFKNLTKRFPGGKIAVDSLNLTFNDGEFIVFIGTSGSGKTTSMRMINRMIEPTSGEILINGKNSKDMNAVELRRQIGYVIQQIGLMPHMTIFDNIVMVPKLLKWPVEKQRKIAEELIQKVDLPLDFLERYPSELSGGQQQRIGVIRALAADQDIILMDEPFGALDPITRDSLQETLKELQRELGKTVIFVTHDMDEALKLADRIVIMQDGKVVQFDTPDNILMDPANAFVENFIGEERLSQARTNFRTVEQIMIRGPVSVSSDQNLSEAIKLMRTRRVDSLFVTDADDILLGMLSVEAIDTNRRRPVTVGEVMSEVSFVREGTLVRDALQRILKLGYKNIPVVNENNQLIGLITRTSIVDMVYDTIWGDIEPEMPAEEVIETTADIETVEG